MKDDEGPEKFATEELKIKEFRPRLVSGSGSGSKPGPGPGAKIFKPTPYQWRNPPQIPPRQFIGGRHLIRKFLSLTIATGGVGKSSLLLADAVSLAAGRKLHGADPNGQFRVWYWNGEDPREEVERRVAALMLHYRIEPYEIGDRLFLDSGRDEGMEIILASQTKNGTIIAQPVEDALTEALIAGKFDVLMIDPFVATHRVTENDNMAIDAIAKTLGRIADKANCGTDLVHHVRKTSGNEITAEDGRGASSLVFAARSVRVLNPMSKEEAEQAKVEVERRGFHFRADIGKANLAPPSEKADWHRLESVALGNGTIIDFDGAAGNIMRGGDVVGVVTAWKWPEAIEGVETHDLSAVRAEITKGQWRKDVRAANWIGIPIAAALKLDIDDRGDKHKIKSLIAAWLKLGMLKTVISKDKNREDRPFVDIGQWT